MKIVVTVKQVPDPNSNLTLEGDNTISRDKEAVLDPGDECGVEEGLQLKEAHGGEVVLVSMGPERAKDAIRSLPARTRCSRRASWPRRSSRSRPTW